MLRLRALSPASAIKGGIGLAVILVLGWALTQDVRSPAFLRAQGVGAGSAQSVPSDTSGLQARTITCGNGRLEPREQCESDAHCIAGQICNRMACHCEGRVIDACGDGVLKSEEQCELGYPCAGRAGACDLKSCTCVQIPAESTCGNTRIDNGEDCEIGVACPVGSACNFAICHCVPQLQQCGNGVLDSGEQCEIGSPCEEEGMACDVASCVCARQSGLAVCGNGQLGGGEECEAGHPCPAGLRCDYPRCRCFDQPRCGDGTLDPGEQCETATPCAGKDQICDFARCRCMRQSVACGNGVPEAREECDDGNTQDGDGCSAACFIEQQAASAEGGERTSDTQGAIDFDQRSVSSAFDRQGSASANTSSLKSEGGPVTIIFPAQQEEGNSSAVSLPAASVSSSSLQWRWGAIVGAVTLLVAGGFYIRRRRRTG